MSRQAHLPPRCPFQRKPIFRTISDTVSSSTSCKDDKPYSRHQKSASQSFVLEDQPPWLDDLLSDSDSTSNGTVHRRSASDSTTVLGSLDPFLMPFKDEENPVEHNSCNGLKLESDHMYGPNSPRQKGNLWFSENAIVTALSDYASQSPPKSSSLPPINFSDPDELGLAGNVYAESKAAKRHSGQRSRVRKLQYIAELERTVNALEALGSELTIRVASLAHQRVALSIENSSLKHQVVKLQQEKLVVEGQHQHLKKEVERLRNCLESVPKSTSVPKYLLGSSLAAGAEAIQSNDKTWQMLDMGKLNIH